MQLSGCYSFTGGSVPEHLKTMQIVAVGDKSGYGNPTYKDMLSLLLVNKFKNDNSFILVDRNGNARLKTEIASIRDEISVVNPGELEKERKMTITCEVKYYDAVKKKLIWKKSFTNYGIYDINNVVEGRKAAVKTALNKISDDILLAVVSGW
jgi:curli biogenesis system outer membrane secretion channel CsgG